jgi:hypothetical protein
VSNEIDGEADNFDAIEVYPTPERDNPKFGAVTLTFTRGMHSQTTRMTTEDAETLLLKLHEYLTNETSN